MNLVFFAHPKFLGQQSMPRYTAMLAEGMRKRGHDVEIWSPEPRLFQLPVSASLKKWLGYIDQYVIFPLEVKMFLRKRKKLHNLYIFTDHALGPWVPLVAKHLHVIHCHDFLAQRSAIDQIAENPTSITGKKYQAYIKQGYTQGKNFISVSQKTKDDLHTFLPGEPGLSAVVYNGLNQAFTPIDPLVARTALSKTFGLNLLPGYLLHVGGNDWYKNRKGVIEIYNAWRATFAAKVPLLLIGSVPSAELLKVHEESPFAGDIHFLPGVEDDVVRLAYAGASVFLFPSLAEGFGWPIAEAMASGCPVITTNQAPMTEVAGNAGFLIDRMPGDPAGISAWAITSAKILKQVLELSEQELKAIKDAGIHNAKRFDTEHSLDQVEAIYKSIHNGHHKAGKLPQAQQKVNSIAG